MKFGAPVIKAIFPNGLNVEGPSHYDQQLHIQLRKLSLPCQDTFAILIFHLYDSFDILIVLGRSTISLKVYSYID